MTPTEVKKKKQQNHFWPHFNFRYTTQARRTIALPSIFSTTDTCYVNVNGQEGWLPADILSPLGKGMGSQLLNAWSSCSLSAVAESDGELQFYFFPRHRALSRVAFLT